MLCLQQQILFLGPLKSNIKIHIHNLNFFWLYWYTSFQPLAATLARKEKKHPSKILSILKTFLPNHVCPKRLLISLLSLFFYMVILSKEQIFFFPRLIFNFGFYLWQWFILSTAIKYTIFCSISHFHSVVALFLWKVSPFMATFSTIAWNLINF